MLVEAEFSVLYPPEFIGCKTDNITGFPVMKN